MDSEASIILFSDLKVTDSKGRPWSIQASIEKRSFCGDLYCDADVLLPHSEADQHPAWELCEDPLILTALHVKLTELGYSGRPLGRGELGAQTQAYFVMEPPDEFLDFLHEKFGWEYTDGMQALYDSRTVRDFNKSFSSAKSLELALSDGSTWTVPLHALLLAFENVMRDECGADRGRLMRHFTNPALKGNEAALLDWLRAFSEEAWKFMKPYAQLKTPSKMDMFTEALKDGQTKFV